MPPVETKYYSDMIAQILDIVANAANAKLAEVTQVLPDLSRVEIELLSQRLRRDGFDSGAVKRIETAKVNTQPACC